MTNRPAPPVCDARELLADLVDAIMHSDQGYEDFILKSMYRAQAFLHAPAPPTDADEARQLAKRLNNAAIERHTITLDEFGARKALRIMADYCALMKEAATLLSRIPSEEATEEETAPGELRPCPFCGGDPEEVTIEDATENHGGSCIGCKRCGASGPVHFDRKENLYSSWNDRGITRAPGAVT